jgi:hypothetical protein
MSAPTDLGLEPVTDEPGKVAPSSQPKEPTPAHVEPSDRPLSPWLKALLIALSGLPI